MTYVERVGTVAVTSPGRTVQTARLLACGVIAGPLFIGAGLIQAFTREGFDLSRHPLSLLSLGDLGWIQIATFMTTGALYLLCAAGMRRVLHPGRAATWGPRLIAVLGVGLIAAGVFTADAGAGFPPGAPAGAPEEITWHGMLHEVGFIVSMLSGTAACFVFMRRFAASKEWGWVAACVTTAVVGLVLASWPDMNGISVRLVIASAALFGFLAALATRLWRGLSDSSAA